MGDSWRKTTAGGPPQPSLPPEMESGCSPAHPELPAALTLNLLLLLQPTETERCIESLLAVFQRYAGREGDDCTLSKREFLAFMNTELAAFTKVSKIQAQRASRSMRFGPRDED